MCVWLEGQKENSFRGQNKSEAFVRLAICDVTKGLIPRVVKIKIRPHSDNGEIKGRQILNLRVTLQFHVGKH